jgi:hypothetical protein
MKKTKHLALLLVFVWVGLSISVGPLFSFPLLVVDAHSDNLQSTAVLSSDQPWEWVEVPAPYRQSTGIDACDFIAPDDGWAVGSNGIILHWDGSDWTAFEGPRPKYYFTSLYDVQMLASDNVWAVGELGYVAHWDGEKWHDVSLPTEYDLNNISLVSSDFGFASGMYGVDLTYKRNMFTWNGSEWTQIAFPEAPSDQYVVEITAIQMVSPWIGWASGIEEFYRWDGVMWQSHELEKAPGFVEINSFFMLTPDDIWASGMTLINTEKYKNGGGIFHWNGIDWYDVYKTPYRIFSLHMLSPKQGWAVGPLIEGGPAKERLSNMIFNWDGNQWSEFYKTDNYYWLTTICGFDQDHLWIFGYSTEKNSWGGPEIVPVTLRLQKKSTPTLSPTQTPSPTPTATLLPPTALVTIAPAPSDTPALLLPSPMPTPSETASSSIPYLPIVIVGIVVAVLAVLLLLLQKK